MKGVAYLAGAGLTAIVFSTSAWCQETSQSGPEAPSATSDIIVTAQRRQERLQDVPITITSISKQTIEEANIKQLGDIVKLSPATRFDYQSAFVQPSIRGVGNAIITIGGTSNVGIYVDGFYSPNPLASNFQLLNIEGIQVLKGPQGTLFGHNTTGGAILVNSSAPSSDTHGIVQASYGRFNTAEVQGYLTTGLGSNMAVDLAGSFEHSDGYAINTIPGLKHPGRLNNWSVRAGLKIDVSPDVSFLLRYSHQHVDDATNQVNSSLFMNGVLYAPRLIVANPASPGTLISVPVPAQLVATGYRQVAINPPDQPRFRFDSDTFQLTQKYDLGFADAASYTQYIKEKGLSETDQDSTALNLLYLVNPTANKTLTQEILLTSKPGSRLQWTVGGFYFKFLDHQGPVIGGPDRMLTQKFYTVEGNGRTQSLAGYADLTYKAGDHVFLTAGVRYNHETFDNATFTFAPFPAVPRASNSNNVVTPRAVIRYEFDGENSAYGSYSRGFKGALTDVVVGTHIKPETMDAFEVGYKHASGQVSFNIAAWYYKYKDLQLSVYENGLSKILNAADARIKGIEGELRYDVTPDFQVNVSGAYVDAKYVSFPNAQRFVRCSDVNPLSVCAAGGYDSFLLTTFDASGDQMQRAPKFSASARARYGFDLAGGRFTVSGNLYHTSSFYFDSGHQFKQNAYDLVGLRAEWTDPSQRVTVAAYGDNLLGTKYYGQIYARSSSASAIWGAPRTWGVSLRYRFGVER